MRLAIIGAGNVGKALGRRLAAARHDVFYGVRNTSRPVDLPTGALRDVPAAAEAEVIVLSTPWTTTQEACRTMGGGRGKVVIDCTNPLVMTGDGLGLAVGYATSGGEMVAGWCPGAFVYKSFNQTGFEIMADPTRFQPRPVMFVAGDDAAHKPTVLQLVRDVGFEARDAGPLASARLLEPYAMVWIDQVLKRGADPAFAFALAHPLA